MQKFSLGYCETPFKYDVITLTKMDNPDQHPGAPIVQIEADYGISRLTRSDVFRLIEWLTSISNRETL